MRKTANQRATETIVQICRELPGPADAFEVLGVALQVVACMSENDRQRALARLAEVTRTAGKELTQHYELYMLTIAAANLARTEKGRVVLESLTVWLEAEPEEGEDKTKH